MLGKAFGIHENNVRTYAEAEIRAGYTSFYLNILSYYGLMRIIGLSRICVTDYITSIVSEFQ